MRRIVAVVAAAVLLAASGCGNDDEVTEAVTIAFLRAVPTEPQPLLREMRAGGYVDGENLRVIPSDEGEVHLTPEDAAEAVEGWIDDGADMIIALSTIGALAAAEVTQEIPILFLVNDPMAVGLIRDKESPEANLTGVTFRVPADRTLSLAAQAVPNLTAVGVLFPADDPAAAPHRDALVAAGPALGIQVVAEPYVDETDLPRAFDALAAGGAQAVVVSNAPAAIRSFGAIEAVATERRVPLVANTNRATTAVVILEPDTEELNAQLGRQAVRVLNGAAPGDVPVEDPRHFRVVVNTSAAASLGLPPLAPDLLRQADEVRS